MHPAADTDPAFDLDTAVAGLRAARTAWRNQQSRPHEVNGRELPSADALRAAVEDLRSVLFPMRLGPPDLRPDTEDAHVRRTLARVLANLQEQATLELIHAARQRGAAPTASHEAQAHIAIEAFARTLPETRTLLDGDVLAAYAGDPAAHSVDEVLLCYPGIRAAISHRIAHRLHGLHLPLVARVIAELAHGETGIDIHPGARIGAGLFIDHGTGVVIGETAVIGRDVRIYQNVTLGARSFPAAEDGSLTKGLPRHPVVEDGVVLYAGATVLGRVTIGAGSVIGGNVWLTHSVPPGSHVTQADAATRPSGQAPA